MIIDGTWNVSIKTSVMPLKGTFVLKTDGDVLSGTATTSFGTNNITDGKVDGNKIEFKVDSATPFGSATLEVKSTIDGDSLKGEAIMQPRGMKATLTGTRKA